MVDNLIRALAEHLGRSSPWHQRFHALQELFTASNLELQGIHSVRWLSRGDAVLRLVDVFPAIIVMLSEYDLEMYELATSYRFHFLLFFIADVLEQLNVLNKTFPQTAWFPTCTHLFASSLIHSFTILTDYSRYTTVFPLAKKSDMTSTLIRWLLTTADTRGRRVSCLHSDRGESPQQNGVSEHRIGLVMEIARTSMTHARAPHFLWPYAVRYAAHHLNLWPPVSRREVSPTSLWTRSLGAASRFHVWGCLALVRDTSADKISPLDVPCVFLGFPEDSSDYTFYHPPLHQFFDSRDARFDKSVPYYVRGASSRGVGVGAEGVPVRGPGSGGAGVGAEPVTAGDSNLQGAGVSGAVPGSATTGGAPSAGPGEPGTDPVTSGGAGSGGGATGSLESGPGATTALDSTPPHPYPTRHQARPEQEQPQQQPQQQQPQQQQQPPPPPVFGLRTLGLPSPSPPTPLSTLVSGLPLPPSDPSPAIFPPPLSPLSPPLSHTWSSRRSPRARPSSPVPFTDLHTALFHSSPPRLSPSVLPSPPESALTASLSTPVIDYYRTYCPVLSRALASLVTDPRASLSSVSTLTAAVPEFASTRCLDYATSLVAAPPTSPLAVGGESALGCDALEDRQFELEFLAAASPHLCAMLLAPEGDPDALDIPTPRTYAEAVSGPWASQWRAPMDSEMASYRSTSTYVNEVPPFGANVVDGMWIFRVKRPPGSPPVFKARYEARGFRQREGVDFFHTFAPTLKMTTLRVLQHVAAQRDYKLHSLDFSTAFLQGSLHEEVWLYRPSAFTGTFPLGTQWRLRRLVYGLRQAPCEWHDTLRSTLSDLGFHPSSADPSLFVRRGSTLFFVLVYADDLVFATTDRVALADVKLKLQKRHSCTDLGELRQYLGLQITRDRAPRTITLSHSHMVQQVLQQFELQHSSVQRTPLAIDHRLTGPFPEESFEPSGPYAELVGCLMYLMTCTRPDLAFPLSILARFVAPGRHRPVHWTAAVRVSNLGSGAISWRPTRSSSVSTSTAEAEICAGAMAAQELRWLTFLLTGLSERLSFVPTLFTDNKATILLCREPRLESRVKYINVRYFLLRELQRRGQARFVFVESEANTADIFTKALPPCDHQRCCVQLGLLCFFVTGLVTVYFCHPGGSSSSGQPGASASPGEKNPFKSRFPFLPPRFPGKTKYVQHKLSFLKRPSPSSTRNPTTEKDGGESRGAKKTGPRILTLEELQLKAKQQWNRHFPSLIIGDTSEGQPCMRCKICMVYADPESQYGARGEGGIDIQKQTMRKHQWSIQHREAKGRLEQREGPQKKQAAISNFGDKSAETRRLIKLLLTVRFLCKSDTPIVMFMTLVQFMAEMGTPDMPAKDQGTYCSTYGFKQLVEALVCYLKEKQMQHISLSPYVGLQLDKSTDRRRGKHMIVYATFLRGTVVVTEFFANLSVEKCDAGSLEAVLLTHLAACGLELQRISGMTTDGASVMTGGQTGLVARLRTRVPHIVPCHCVAHREALAAKDDVEEFPEFNVVDKVVRAFADILGRSIVQHARFKNLQEVITQTNLEMQGIKYVRWLSRGDAIERFADVLPAAVVLLHKYDKATYTLVTSLKFQFFLFFLVDVLQELNSLNLKFQRRQVRTRDSRCLA
ncbi:unnamed protein product [Closterium sp. NIES-53]